MTDTPSDPNDANPTTRFDPTPAPAPVVPPIATPPPFPVAPQAPAVPPGPDPTWQPRSGDPGRTGTIIFGVILLGIGLWFFADQTLGLDMPRLRWSQLWPVFLIGLGVWIAIGSIRRR
jgi:cell wall-active antibiotic response 4TMS protein YvqF